MADRCEAEACPFWTGHGCACDVMDIDPEERAKVRGQTWGTDWKDDRG